MSKHRIIVIGGGASGLMAAITAASHGANVTIVEQNNSLGKKLCATGNGKCNLTNTHFAPDIMYRSGNQEFVRKAFEIYGVSDTIRDFESLGIQLHDRNGYLYPRSGQAKTVVNALNAKAVSLKIKIKTNEHIERIAYDASEHIWKAFTNTWCYEGERLILANGSKASNISGSDGSGYEIASELGLRIVRPLPALCPLKCKGIDFRQWSGVRTEGSISLYIEDQFLCSEKGELQLTDYGVSGIPVFQISRYAICALDSGKKVRVILDFVPELRKDELQQVLDNMTITAPYKSKAEIIEGFLPDKLSRVIALQKDTVKAMKEFGLDVTGHCGFEKAQVCSGGVDLSQINPNTMETRHYPGLYITGELLDVDAICGGYNLQWAWTSGYIAGVHSSKK